MFITDIMLGCIVLGEDRAFHIDARDLILWKINIPESNKREICPGIDIKQKFGGIELDDDLTPIGEYFNEPPEELSESLGRSGK